MSNVVYGSESYTKPVTAYIPIPTDGSALGKRSVKIRCNNCSQEQFTCVKSKMSDGGKRWAFMCCLIGYAYGGCLSALFALCYPGFREYSHYCTSCTSLLGVYRPTMGGGQLCLLVVLSILMIAIQYGLIWLIIYILQDYIF